MILTKQTVWMKFKDGSYLHMCNNKTIITKDGKTGVIKNDGREVVLTNLNGNKIWLIRVE